MSARNERLDRHRLLGIARDMQHLLDMIRPMRSLLDKTSEYDGNEDERLGDTTGLANYMAAISLKRRTLLRSAAAEALDALDEVAKATTKYRSANSVSSGSR